MKLPWLDYRRRLSPLKLAVFAFLFAPGTWTAVALASGALEPRPLNAAIHQIGLWVVRFLFAALAVTPLRAILNWPRLILVRRMLDVAKVASEIALRVYLTIGFTALLGLCALAATSTDAMVRRLGRRWQRLHR